MAQKNRGSTVATENANDNAVQYIARAKKDQHKQRPASHLCNGERLDAIFGDGPHHCAMCGAADNLEVDHITPRRLGGDHRRNNLQLLCAECHRTKTLTDGSGDASPPIAVTILDKDGAPVTYKSIKAAERATGISARTISTRIKKGTVLTLLHDYAGHKAHRFAKAKNPVYWRGNLYLSKNELKRQRNLSASAVSRAFFYGSVAWSLKCYRKSRRWLSLERHMHDGVIGMRSCGECGRPADRLALVEVWTDLMVRPFELETYAICGPCRERVDADIKPLIDDAVNRYKNIIQAQPKTHDDDGNLTPTEYRQRLMDFRRRQRGART